MIVNPIHLDCHNSLGKARCASQVQNPCQWHCTEGQTRSCTIETTAAPLASIRRDIVGDYESIILIAGQEAAASRRGREANEGEQEEGIEGADRSNVQPDSIDDKISHEQSP